MLVKEDNNMELRIKNFWQNPDIYNYNKFTSPEKKILLDKFNNDHRYNKLNKLWKYKKVIQQWNNGLHIIDNIYNINVSNEQDIQKYLSQIKKDKIKSITNNSKNFIFLIQTYFKIKYPKTCLFFNNDIIQMVIENKKLNYIPKKFENIITECKNKNYAIFIIYLTNKDLNHGHTISLFIDITLNQYYIFNTSNQYQSYMNMIKQKIDIFLFNNIPNFNKLTYRQLQCPIPKYTQYFKNLDIKGYCYYWVLWFIDNRLNIKFQNLSSQSIIHNINKQLNTNPVNYLFFIRIISLYFMYINYYVQHVKKHLQGNKNDIQILKIYFKNLNYYTNIEILKKICKNPKSFKKWFIFLNNKTHIITKFIINCISKKSINRYLNYENNQKFLTLKQNINLKENNKYYDIRQPRKKI